MPRGVNHSEEFARISAKEDNRSKGPTDVPGGFSKRFPEKGQMHNPTDGGGINRRPKGKGKASKTYTGNAK